MPGPQNYDPYKPSGSPMCKIGTGRRVSLDDRNRTGPGDYSPERYMHSSMKQFPRYGMGSSSREGFNILNSNPGPQHYSQK